MGEKLKAKHDEHIKVYGEGNDRRLTGAHETAPITAFSYGVANRGASVRIPRDTEKDKCGYFEDRRPASNMDPYVVTAKIFETAVSDHQTPRPLKLALSHLDAFSGVPIRCNSKFSRRLS